MFMIQLLVLKAGEVYIATPDQEIINIIKKVKAML